MVIYTDAMLDDSTASYAYASLLQAFPKMTDMMANVIIERMIANRFSSSRAVDAINQVIDTYEGWDKLPNVANFIRFYRRVKLHTYRQMDSMVRDGVAEYGDFAIARVEGVSGCKSAEADGKPPLYILRVDAEMFHVVTRDCRPLEGWND